MKTKKLGELVEISSGQIMSRVVVKETYENQDFETMKVIIPKAISDTGRIIIEELGEEKIKSKPDNNRITEVGDIVIKLSAPYNAALITKESAGCIVPSFCAIIRNLNVLDKNYLIAFLNSKLCQEQLKSMVAGVAITILSITKLKDVEIPIVDIKKQIDIGNQFVEVQERIDTMRKIIELETKKNDIEFFNMVK